MKNAWMIIVAAFFLLAVGTTTCFGQVYKYKDEKGNWCFTDSGGTMPPGTQFEELREEEPAVDLQAKVAGKFPPKNDLERARNATVLILNENKGIGTGFFITPKGYIITNRHVADDTNGVYRIILIDRTEFTIYGAELSDKYDIALLRLKGYNCPFIEQANPKELGIGDALYAIGMPKALMHSVTSGVFSSYRKLDDNVNYIQTNAQINTGNSGGPLITKEGKVVGVNTLKRIDAEGIGFAIPIDLVADEFKRRLAK